MRGHRGISKKADDYSPAFTDLASTTIPTWAGGYAQSFLPTCLELKAVGNFTLVLPGCRRRFLGRFE